MSNTARNRLRFSTDGRSGLLRFMEAADLHPLIDSVYPFEQIHAAFERAQ